jgi:putative membrane protein
VEVLIMGWFCGNALWGNGLNGMITGGIMILFWGGMIAIGYFLIKSLIRGHGNSAALGILQERFVRGEISQVEYDEMKAKL